MSDDIIVNTTDASGSQPSVNPTGLHIVLLIHGIRTHADWQEMVASRIEIENHIKVIPIKYGFFSALAFWLLWPFRTWPVMYVHKQLRVVKETYPNAQISVIAHSFGTYIIGRILLNNFDVKIHRLVLCGSVLDNGFAWEKLLRQISNDSIINECGKKDHWPVLAKCSTWGYGDSGTNGFGAALVIDRFHNASHSQYFEQQFVDEYWVPWIRNGEYKRTTFEVSRPPTPLCLSLLGRVPIKWIVLILFLCACYVTLSPFVFAVWDHIVSRQDRTVTLYLRHRTRPFEKDFTISVRVPGSDQITKRGEKGVATIQLPGYVKTIDDIAIRCSGYELKNGGPFEIPNDGVIHLDLKTNNVLPPLKPDDFPPEASIPDLPSEEIVKTPPRVAPADVRIRFKNSADSNLKLLLFSWSNYYKRKDGIIVASPWIVLDLPAKDAFCPLDGFTGGSGWFSVYVWRDDHESGDKSYVHLGLYDLFQSRNPVLEITETGELKPPYKCTLSPLD